MTRREFEQKCEEVVNQRLKEILKDYSPNDSLSGQDGAKLF